MLIKYGEEVIALGQLVQTFCLKQGNLKEANTPVQLTYARDAWKELYRRTIWQAKRQVLEVDCRNNTVQLPLDCERLLNISVVDKLGRLHPLTCDSDLNTTEIRCTKTKCSCKKCNGQNTLCSALDSTVTYTTQQILIQGTYYTQETFIKYDGSGSIQQDIKMPILDAATGKVVYQHQISTLCNVETTEHGCIKATGPNREALGTYIGFGWDEGFAFGGIGGWENSAYRGVLPTVYNFWGYYNINAEDQSIVHIFRNDNARHNRTNILQSGGPQSFTDNITQVIVTYQTNGEVAGEEILVPQYAVRAVEMGIMYYQKYYNIKVPAREKKEYYDFWRLESNLVNRHLNPIPLEVLAKLQTRARKW